MRDKVICDLGCGNSYFMLRMLEHNPKLVIGLDPNLHAWLTFKMFTHFHSFGERVQFEILRGENCDLFQSTFDIFFCLGVLYHTPDPIGVLKNIRKSLRKKGVLIVDCQGIDGPEPIALFPKRKYANMKGVYFLPTISALTNWLTRTGFNKVEIIFAEPLSTSEQRQTEWAAVSSLSEALISENNVVKTVEGYQQPMRFYVKAHI